MEERVHSKGDKHFPSLFQFSLIKLLVLHELKKRNISWDIFLSVVGLLAHEDIVKEIRRDKGETSKGKRKILVEESQFIHRPRTRFSTKQLIEELTPKVDILEDMLEQGTGEE